MGLDDLKAAWDAEANKPNKWDDLGTDEIVAFAVEQARAESAAEIERLWAWIAQEAYCTCCEEYEVCADGCTFAEDCPDANERMLEVRAFLAHKKGS